MKENSVAPSECAELSAVRLFHVVTVPMTLQFLSGQMGLLSERGFRVTAVSSPGEELEAFAQREQVRSVAVQMHRAVTPLRDLGALIALARAFHRAGPHVVHAHTPKAGLLGMLAAWLTRVPVRIYHMRGLPFLGSRGPKRWLLRWTEMVSCALAHRVLCVSHSLREVAVLHGLSPPEKIKVLLGGSGQGVDAVERFDPDRLPAGTRQATRDRFGIPESAFVVGFVGRLVRDKGISELVGAWETLRCEFPQLHLLVVGPFEPQDPVPAAIERALREDPRVHLAGEDWNTPPLYAAMDVVALPSYREGFPNVPLEAASMQRPVVATSIPGCVDAVDDGFTGTLVPPRDAPALASAIRGYLVDRELRTRHGNAGRVRVLREFQRSAITEAIFQEYVSLLRTRGVALPSEGARPAASGPTGDHVGVAAR